MAVAINAQATCDCQSPAVFGHHCPPRSAPDDSALVAVIACTPDCRWQHEVPRDRDAAPAPSAPAIPSGGIA